MRWLFRLIDWVRGPAIFRLVWHLLTSVSRLTDAEVAAASSVLGADSIRYDRVRVTEGRVLGLLFKLNKRRAFTTFHTINLPAAGPHSRPNLNIVVHELVHVYQFEKIGSVYIYEALRAQRTGGYDYGGPDRLVADRANGEHFKDYNREQQGQIAQDYYAAVVGPGLPDTDPLRQKYEPLIDELRAGDI